MIEVYQVPEENYGKDLVEVVRCKDCKNGIQKSADSVLCFKCSVVAQIMNPLDFCSDGERKQAEQ